MINKLSTVANLTLKTNVRYHAKPTHVN